MTDRPSGRAPLAPTLGAALVLAALIAGGVLHGWVGTATAQTDAVPPTRVVFAIDNSGSMFGAPGEPASDPEQQRIEGVRDLIEVLRGFLGTVNEQRLVELGALSFGSGEPEVLSELTSVLGRGLPDRLGADRIGGGTDFRAGLCGAWILATRQAPPPGTGCPEPSPEYLRAADASAGRGTDPQDGRLLVVLITDGSPAPAGDELVFDGNPSAASCAAGAGGYDHKDGDAYLCALAATWQALRAERAADLVVIGIDEPGQWFPAAEPYWQRVAQCGSLGQPSCEDRVVHSVDPSRLAELILRTFPGVDLCDFIPADDSFNCSVPGGLVSVRFQIVGRSENSSSTVGTSERVTFNSAEGPVELTELRDGTHIWRFDRPGAGLWSLMLEGDGPPSEQVKVIVDPDPARFDIELRSWDEQGLILDLKFHPTAAGRVAVPSLLTQRYRVELLRDGLVIDKNESLLLEHDGGEKFMATAAFEPPLGSTAAHEVVLYLRTLLVGRVRLSDIPEATPTETATPAPTPDPTPLPTPLPTPDPLPTLPPCSELSAVWEGEAATAPRWRPAVRLGFPLPVRFRDSARWSVAIEAADCTTPIEGDARILGCDSCATAAEGPVPLTLEVPADGLSGDSARRQVGWYVPASGLEDSLTEEVRLVDVWLLHWEPLWALALHLLAVALMAVCVSAVSVRTPHAWRKDDQSARSIDLTVPDERHRLVGIVRLGTFVWRRTPARGRDATEQRLLTLRWLILGALVARDTRGEAPTQGRWLGIPTAQLDDEMFRRLDIRRPRQPRI